MKKRIGALAIVCLFVFVLVLSYSVNLTAGDAPAEGECCTWPDPPTKGVWNGGNPPNGWCDCQGLYIGGGQYINPNNCVLWCEIMP